MAILKIKHLRTYTANIIGHLMSNKCFLKYQFQISMNLYSKIFCDCIENYNNIYLPFSKLFSMTDA